MKWIITGGAGFIGCNTVDQLVREGHEVVVIDNLFRRGSEKNLAWLQEKHPNIGFVNADVRDYDQIKATFHQHADANVILHLAAQTAVTTSVTNPRQDFDINATGSFNVLEAVRELHMDPVVIYSSTNKVYGEMTQATVVEREGRYYYQDYPQGISEQAPLDFHSPYGCSKGVADQYMHDYSRIYGMRTIVFRNSCIYGPRQFGVEDQGWVAWFIIAVVMGKPITIYGDGKQVRDILYVGDLVNAFISAAKNIDITRGQVYNMGGGADNTMSIWTEFQPILTELFGRVIPVSYGDWRPGDQKVYVSDTTKARRDLNWKPQYGVKEGIKQLYDWVVANRHLFENF